VQRSVNTNIFIRQRSVIFSNKCEVKVSRILPNSKWQNPIENLNIQEGKVHQKIEYSSGKRPANKYEGKGQ
jgi:hypothetical protein